MAVAVTNTSSKRGDGGNRRRSGDLLEAVPLAPLADRPGAAVELFGQGLDRRFDAGRGKSGPRLGVPPPNGGLVEGRPPGGHRDSRWFGVALDPRAGGVLVTARAATVRVRRSAAPAALDHRVSPSGITAVVSP